MAQKLTINKPLVLLVFADRAHARALAKILEHHGASVENIDTLEGAINEAKRKPIAAIFMEFTTSTAVAASVAVGHGIPIYAVNFNAECVQSAVMEALESGVTEVFESRRFGAQAETLVLDLEEAGNRYAEQPGGHGLAFGASAYSLEELLEMPSDLTAEEPATASPTPTRGLSLDEAGDASSDVTDSMGLEFVDDESLEQEARGDGPRLTEQFSVSTDSTTQALTDAISIMEGRVTYMLRQHERLLLNQVTRIVHTATQGNEIRIHEIASAVSAQNAEEVMAGMLRVIRRQGNSHHSAADEAKQEHTQPRNNWRTALKLQTRDLWIMAATTVVLVGALTIVQRFFL